MTAFFPEQAHRFLLRIAAAAAAFAMPWLSGCGSFLFVSPDRPEADIPHAAAEPGRYYRISETDNFSCMRIYLPPETADRPVPAVVIFPGGAYGVLAMDKEGYAYAEFLNDLGIAGIVVKYPLGSIFGNFRRHPDMINAARRAIRLIRLYAPQLGIDPNRIGVMGSSAGGHLAGLCAAAKDDAAPGARHPAERLSGRPDFAIFCYPLVTLTGDRAHKLSRSNLLGSSPEPGLAEKLSLENLVSADFPPTFLWTTLEDATVDPENSRMLADALRRNNIPHRARFYAHGPHGMGLLSGSEQEKYPETARWKDELVAFLREQGILKTEKP